MVYGTAMSSEPLLIDVFVDVLSKYYNITTAQKLAKAHAEAHEQFLHEIGLARGGKRYKGVVTEDTAPKKVVQVRKPTRQNKRNAVLKRRVGSTESVDHDVIDGEILSLLKSVGEPVVLDFIADNCSNFGWSYAQVRVAVRRMFHRGLVEKRGTCRGTAYSYKSAKVRQVRAKVGAESLPADHPPEQ